MILSVPNTKIRRQAYSTSCWISASRYVLQYLEVDVALPALHARFYNPNPNSASMMTGAGHPSAILSDYAFDAGRIVKTLDPQKEAKRVVVAAIADNIRDGIPVIAGIRSRQVKGFGHAVVITAVNPVNGTVAFKDPGTGGTARAFGSDVRTLLYDEFVNGFSYQYSNAMQLQRLRLLQPDHPPAALQRDEPVQLMGVPGGPIHRRTSCTNSRGEHGLGM